jgi:hypothetical protein
MNIQAGELAEISVKGMYSGSVLKAGRCVLNFKTLKHIDIALDVDWYHSYLLKVNYMGVTVLSESGELCDGVKNVGMKVLNTSTLGY